MLRPPLVLLALTWLLLASPASATPVRIDFSGAFFADSEILRFDVIYVAFRDPSGAMFSNDALQAYVPQGIAAQVETTGCRWTAESHFDYCDPFSGDTFLASLAIDAYRSVPEPGAAALVALGIALLAGRSGIR